jgi:hypothetical protein
VRTHRSVHNLYWHISERRLAFTKRSRYYFTTLNDLRVAGLLDETTVEVVVHPATSPLLSGELLPDDDLPIGSRVRIDVAARVFMKSEATLKRWAVGTMPQRAGDPRNPWQPNTDPTQPPECIEGKPGDRYKHVVITPTLALWLRRHPEIRERFVLAVAGRL